MNKKILFLAGVAFVLFAALGLVWFQAQPSHPPRANEARVELSIAETVEPPPVEAFIGESAKEVADPVQAMRVKDNTNSNSAPDADCLDSASQDFDCYDTHYAALTKEQGAQSAFADLRVRYPGNPYIQSQCHPIAHVIGRAAADKYASVSEAYTQGDSFCWSGYYHGVLEGIVARIGKDNVIAQFNNICADIPGQVSYSFDYYNCVHGLGHGVMAMTDNELFSSLKLCDNLTGAWEQASCWSGAFMENVIVDNKYHFSKYLKPDQPLYPCNAVEEKYKNTCYLMQTSYMLKITGENFSKVFELCGTVEESYRATCYQSLGRDASGHSISNVDSTKSACNLGKDFEQKSNCIIGAVKDFISYHHSDLQARELCNAIDPQIKDVCLSTAESYYKIL